MPLKDTRNVIHLSCSSSSSCDESDLDAEAVAKAEEKKEGSTGETFPTLQELSPLQPTTEVDYVLMPLHFTAIHVQIKRG